MAKPNDPGPAGKLAGSLLEESVTELRTPDRLGEITDEFARLLGRKPPKPGTIAGGKYKLVEKLGAGAMGEVWKAINVAIELKVAIKLLKPELLADARFRSRFQREAQAIASVQHPNVARFFDVVVGDPTFLVMEYVEGVTLKSVLEHEGRLAPRRAIAIAVGLARALEAVHGAGVIHRDLKPSNILLTTNADGVETPRVIDFGLAKVTRGDGTMLTRPGQVVGTPAYMSPEQCGGEEVDARVDIYALGCVMFHMLTGKQPFVGEDVEILYKHLHTPPQSLEGLSGVNKVAAAVVAKAMAKKPEDRYASAGAMARVIEQALPPQPGTPRGRIGDWARARSRRAALLTAAVVALLALSVGMVVGRGWLRRGGGGDSRALLVIVSSPADARVVLDGKLLDEPTPTAIRGIAPGKHQVRIHREGFNESVRQVTTVEAGRASVEVVLAAAGRQLEVRTLPPGAAVFIDGEPAANASPARVTLSNGEFHEVRVEKSGYQTLSHTVRPEDSDEVLSLSLQPESSPHGAVVVDANAAAEVWIDGVYTGFVTPTLALRVTAGKHLIELRDADGRRLDATQVHVARGETRRMLMSVRPAAPR